MDATESNNETFIIGKWAFLQSEDKGTKITVNAKDTLVENISTIYKLLTNEYEYTIFKKDKSATTLSFIEGNQKTYNAKYSIDYNKITISPTTHDYDNKTIKATILELNSTTLKIQDDYQESIRPNITIKVKRTNTYQRLRES